MVTMSLRLTITPSDKDWRLFLRAAQEFSMRQLRFLKQSVPESCRASFTILRALEFVNML